MKKVWRHIEDVAVMRGVEITRVSNFECTKKRIKGGCGDRVERWYGEFELDGYIYTVEFKTIIPTEGYYTVGRLSKLANLKI